MNGIGKLTVIVVLVSFLFMHNAYAEQKQSPQPKKTIKIKEIVIKQRVIKPQAMFILSKSQQANVKSDITTSQTFSQEIIKTSNRDFLR